MGAFTSSSPLLPPNCRIRPVEYFAQIYTYKLLLHGSRKKELDCLERLNKYQPAEYTSYLLSTSLPMGWINHFLYADRSGKPIAMSPAIGTSLDNLSAQLGSLHNAITGNSSIAKDDIDNLDGKLAEAMSYVEIPGVLESKIAREIVSKSLEAKALKNF